MLSCILAIVFVLSLSRNSDRYAPGLILLITNKMVKPRKLKFGLNIRINESVVCANFGDPRSRDCELRHKNIKGNFGFENLLIRSYLKNHLTCKAETWTQYGCL